MSDARARTPSALRYPDFTRFLVARFLSTLAVQMQSVAIGWQVYAITRDPLDLGLIGLAQFLPFLAVVLPAGQIADRHDRRGILAACLCDRAACARCCCWRSRCRGLTVVWPVFAVLVLFGTARAFSMPTSQAITPNLVPIESFGNAVALNSSSFQIATIAGPDARRRAVSRRTSDRLLDGGRAAGDFRGAHVRGTRAAHARRATSR